MYAMFPLQISICVTESANSLSASMCHCPQQTSNPQNDREKCFLNQKNYIHLYTNSMTWGCLSFPSFPGWKILWWSLMLKVLKDRHPQNQPPDPRVPSAPLPTWAHGTAHMGTPQVTWLPPSPEEIPQVMCLGGIIPGNSRNSETIAAIGLQNSLELVDLDIFGPFLIVKTRLKYLRFESSVSILGSNAQKKNETVQILTMFVGIDLSIFFGCCPCHHLSPQNHLEWPPQKKKTIASDFGSAHVILGRTTWDVRISPPCHSQRPPLLGRPIPGKDRVVERKSDSINQSQVVRYNPLTNRKI